MSPSSLAERALQTVHMARAQKRLSARPRRRPQSLLTGLLPLAAPTGYTQPTYLQFTGHGSLWEVTFCEQSRGLFASAFEGLQVATQLWRIVLRGLKLNDSPRHRIGFQRRKLPIAHHADTGRRVAHRQAGPI